MVSEPGVNGVHGEADGIQASMRIGPLGEAILLDSHQADAGSATPTTVMITTTGRSMTTAVPPAGMVINASGIVVRPSWTEGHKLSAWMVPCARN